MDNRHIIPADQSVQLDPAKIAQHMVHFYTRDNRHIIPADQSIQLGPAKITQYMVHFMHMIYTKFYKKKFQVCISCKLHYQMKFTSNAIMDDFVN